MHATELVVSTGDPAFAVDAGGRIRAWNQAAEALLGHRRSEVVGHHCWEILRGRDIFGNRYCGDACPLREMALASEPACRTRLLVRNGVGEEVCLELSILVLRRRGNETEIVHVLRPPSAAEEPAPHCRPPASAPGERLTRRQLEVLRLLARGRGTVEISELLGISAHTARHHIQNLLERLKVHTRLEAVAVAQRIGLI